VSAPLSFSLSTGIILLTMKVYTKNGDSGETMLLFGGRISKSNPRAEAYGEVDTSVSAMGLARALSKDDFIKTTLLKIQREMFTVGSELATSPDKWNSLRSKYAVVTADMVSNLEEIIDRLQGDIEMPPEFIVPGGSPGSGALDLARSMVRTAERRVVALSETGEIKNREVLRYLNRVSDLLFIMARYEDRDKPFELSSEKRV